jgi:hypothetical protein
MNIPELVKEHCLKHCKRMPETGEEVNQYLDLINHLKEYETAVRLKSLIGIEAMKKWGLLPPDEVKAKGEKLFSK